VTIFFIFGPPIKISGYAIDHNLSYYS